MFLKAITRLVAPVLLVAFLDGCSQPTSPEVRGALADTAQSCTDQLQGRELDFGAAGAAEDLERLVALHDASSIAAVIVEPMQGSDRKSVV